MYNDFNVVKEAVSKSNLRFNLATHLNGISFPRYNGEKTEISMATGTDAGMLTLTLTVGGKSNTYYIVGLNGGLTCGIGAILYNSKTKGYSYFYVRSGGAFLVPINNKYSKNILNSLNSPVWSDIDSFTDNLVDLEVFCDLNEGSSADTLFEFHGWDICVERLLAVKVNQTNGSLYTEITKYR